VHFSRGMLKLGRHEHHGRRPGHDAQGSLGTMKKLIAATFAGVLALSVGACNTPQDRALGGAGLGALAGAAIGGAATGRAGGALAGAAIGGAGGAIVGASTAPRCPYGTYRDAYGDVYCR
jgi:osmotically inducible lipoprotein OsmB